MRVSRADRSRVAEWWFTVDRVLVGAVLAIVGAGLVLSQTLAAASQLLQPSTSNFTVAPINLMSPKNTRSAARINRRSLSE